MSGVLSISRERLQAMVDTADTDPRGFEGITDPEVAKCVLNRMHGRTTEAMLERILNSSHPQMLLEHYCTLIKANRRALLPLAQALLKTVYEWDTNALQQFANFFWTASVRDFLARAEYRRAWEEIGKAYRGCPEKDGDSVKNETFEAVPHGPVERLAASIHVVARLIGELHEALSDRGLVPVIAQPTLTIAPVVRTKIPGVTFAARFAVGGNHYAMCSLSRQVRIDSTGQQILAIARYISNERQAKRSRKHEAALTAWESEHQD